MPFPLDRENNTNLALKIVLFSAAAVFGAWLLYELKVLIICLILSVTLASAIAPLAEAGERRKIPRAITVLALYLSAATIYVILAALLAPTIKEQCQKLVESLPAYTSGLNHWYQNALSATGNGTTVPSFTFDDLKNLSFKLLHQTLDMTAGLIGLLLNALLTLFLAAYFVVEAKQIHSAIFRWIPPSARQTVADLIVPVSLRMGGYVRGQLLVALGVAVILTAGFSMIGVKYALVLGILAGLLNLIPYIGSLIACSFAAVVAFNQTPLLAAAVLAVYGIEQWIETAFLVPFFLGKQAFLHPLIVLLAIVAGGTLLGVTGAIIAVPLASAILYLGEEFYVKRYASTDSDVHACEDHIGRDVHSMPKSGVG